MNITRDFKNNLLKRREVFAVVENNVNPGFEKVREKIASHFEVDKDLVIVKNLKSKFGSHLFEINALIYDSLQDKEMIEPRPKARKAKSGETAAVNPGGSSIVAAGGAK